MDRGPNGFRIVDLIACVESETCCLLPLNRIIDLSFSKFYLAW